jgi:hypothetical protein
LNLLLTSSLGKISPTCQGKSLRARLADLSSKDVVSFASAHTMKRFRLSRCASAD